MRVASASAAGWGGWRPVGGVEHDPGDLDEGVVGGGVDGDPLAGALVAVGLEQGGVAGDAVADVDLGTGQAGVVEHEVGRA